MPNSYYENDNPPLNATKANANNEDSDRDALEAAFDLLPEPSALNAGELNFQGTDSGAVNAYAVSVSKITALASGQRVTFIPANTNTGASTINVSALGASAIIGLDGTSLSAGEIVSGRPVTVIRQGTSWYLQNSALNSKALASAAEASASAAALSASYALASENAAAASANVTLWVSGTTYPQGQNVYSPVNFQTYRRKVAGGGVTDPSADSTNWEPLTSVPGFKVAASRSSNTVIGAADRGFLIPMTSTYTQTFGDISTFGPDWFVRLANEGTGDITLTFFGANTCDGLTTFVVYPGEVRTIFLSTDGTALESIVVNGFEKTFNSSGTFTKPPGYKKTFDGLAWSAGASGARDASAAKGGHGGGCFPFSIPVASFGTSETITIGSGGTARTTDGVPNVGGNTTIGSLLTVVGAVTNISGAVSANGTTAISVTGSDPTGFGAAQEAASAGRPSVYGGSTTPQNANAASGSSIYGGAAGGSHDGTLRAAGTSLYGGNGGAAGDATNGAEGEQPAGGGGATRTGTQSGAGGNGRVIIRGVI